MTSDSTAAPSVRTRDRRRRPGVRLALAAAMVAGITAFAPRPATAASVAQTDSSARGADPSSAADALLRRLAEIEVELARADVVEARSLQAEASALVEALSAAVETRLKAVQSKTGSVRHHALARSAALPTLADPLIVVAAADLVGPPRVEKLDRRGAPDGRDRGAARRERREAVTASRDRARAERRRQGIDESEVSDLSTLLMAATPGTVILLEPGHHTIDARLRARSTVLSSIALIGPGPDRCTIHVSEVIPSPAGMLIEGVRLDLDDDEFISAGTGGRFVLRDVEIEGFNSGAGGSNAIFATGPSMFVLERVGFDGEPGRQQDGQSYGDALDVRGDVLVHMRHVRFKNVEEIGRFDALGSIDRCVAIAPPPARPPGGGGGVARTFSTTAYVQGNGEVRTRSSAVPVAGFNFTAAATPFLMTVDDPEVIRVAAGGEAGDTGLVAAAKGDVPAVDTARAAQDAGALVDAMGLRERPAYWIALLDDPRDDVRAIAARQLDALLGAVGFNAAMIAPPADGLAAEVERRSPGFLARLTAHAWWRSVRPGVEFDPARGTFVSKAR